MTRFGMMEADFETLAGFIAEVVKKNVQVKEEVYRYRESFLEMKYVLPYQKAAPIAARILQSILPTSDYAKMFADTLVNLS
jgi:hypothetical protein